MGQTLDLATGHKLGNLYSGKYCKMNPAMGTRAIMNLGKSRHERQIVHGVWGCSGVRVYAVYGP